MVSMVATAWGRCLAVAMLMLAGLPAAAAIPESDEAEDLARIEAYLNSLTSLRADLVQINPDGTVVTGRLYFARPDRLRIDYDPPNDILIIANDWDLLYYDRKLDQESHLFTSQTPLGFLLEDEIRLSGGVTVTKVERRAGELLVTLVRTDEPDQGALTLVFAERPLELRRWTVVDPQGLQTQVLLENLQTGVALDKALFRRPKSPLDPDRRN